MKLNEPILPHKNFQKLYKIYMFLTLALTVLPWYIPVLIFAPIYTNIILFFAMDVPILVIVLFTLYWIPKYYKSVSYTLTNNEVIWKKGVWFKKTGMVPYNRITNVEIDQGPISRKLNLGALHIHTAGYSTQQTAEVLINGLSFDILDDVQEKVMSFVLGKKPVATQVFDEKENNDVLSELKKIRKLLEKKKSPAKR